MIETRITRTRTKPETAANSEQLCFEVADGSGEPVDEDVTYDAAHELTSWRYPGSTGDAFVVPESVISDEPGSLRYRGDPISKVLEKIEALKEQYAANRKEARSQARRESTRSVKLRRLTIRTVVVPERLVYDRQGGVRRVIPGRKRTIRKWMYFTVQRVEPVRYRRLKALYVSRARDRYLTERSRLLQEVRELKARRMKELRKELRTARAAKRYGVIPIQADGSFGLVAHKLPSGYATRPGAGFTPDPITTQVAGGTDRLFDDHSGVGLWTMWVGYKYGRLPGDVSPNTGRDRQTLLYLPVSTAGQAEVATELPVPNAPVLVPEPFIGDRANLTDIRAEINRLSAAVQSGHLSERDRSFILARSIGELKDLPATFRQGMGFLNSLGNLAKLATTSRGQLASRLVGALTSKSTLKEAASWWLAWKFAIKPTIDDATYLLDNGLAAASEIRRTLSDLSKDLHDELVNITTRGLVHRVPILGSVGTGAADRQIVGSVSTRLRIHGYARFVCYPASFPESGDPWPRSYHRLWEELEAGGGSVVAIGPDDYRDGQYDVEHWTQVQDNLPYVTLNGVTLSYKDFVRQGGSAGFSRRVADETSQAVARAVIEAPVHIPVELRERVSAAVTAQFWLADLQALFSDRGPLQVLVDKAEPILTAWELAPLSFVVDWLATTHRSILTLSDLVSKQYAGLDPRDVVVSLTNTLYGFSPRVSSELTLSSAQVTKQTVDVRTFMRFAYERHEGMFVDRFGENPETGPCASIDIEELHDLSLLTSPGPLVKTGLRRFIRGRYQRSLLERVIDSLPRLRLRLDASKVATLVAMFGFR